MNKTICYRASLLLLFHTLLSLFGQHYLKAQDTLIYTPDQPVIDIGRYARYHSDSDDRFSLNQLQTLPDDAFQKSKTRVMNFRNTIASIYIKLYVQNKSTEQLYLSFDNNELQHIEVLTIDKDGQQTMQISGGNAPVTHRFIKRGGYVLKIGEQPTLVYMKVKTLSPFYFPVIVSSLPSLMNVTYKRDVFNGLTLGIMLAMLLYNLFIYSIVRERLYLYYCFYVLATIWTFLHVHGAWFFFWSDHPFLNRFLAVQVTALAAAIFSFRFLNSRELTPVFFKIMSVMFVLIAIMIPCEYFDVQPFTNYFVQIIVSAGAFVLFCSGVAAYFAGNKSAKYYSIAWIFFFSGSITTLLSFMGIVPFNMYTFNAAVIGACFENLFLSFALANRINIYREESSQAQALAYQRLEENERLVREQNRSLEEKVQERTLELEQSLDTLKATQSQLVQSEKLASLGELTAGIAHEIQNPLNFVNNFSDLSIDLVKDLKTELGRADKEESYIEELFSDLSQNQEKINHHGKRASSIVTGMLEHSRTSTGIKEPADINKLADEYLRLSYHGLRAKDKTFNASLKTAFDENLPKVPVVPQDFGRVLLNLCNNAFYAVNERKKNSADTGYMPTVTISTENTKNQITIIVEDNGTGIPQYVIEKLFQPFFTTKPTGKGTGLGLSLSYDIITNMHGGTIEVKSTEMVGTAFIIKLPLSH